MEAIDRWVLRRALELRATPPGRDPLEVNLSAGSIGREVVPLLERELAAGGFDPSRLIVEINETAAIADMTGPGRSPRPARLGVRVALDDSAPASAPSPRSRLPMDYLKIDGEFVAGLARTRSTRRS